MQISRYFLDTKTNPPKMISGYLLTLSTKEPYGKDIKQLEIGSKIVSQDLLEKHS